MSNRLGLQQSSQPPNARSVTTWTSHAAVARPLNSSSRRPEPHSTGQVKSITGKNPLSQRESVGLFAPERKTSGRRNSERVRGAERSLPPSKEASTLSLVSLGDPLKYKPTDPTEPLFFKLLSTMAGGPGQHALFFGDDTSQTAFFRPKGPNMRSASIILPRRLEDPVVVEKRSVRLDRLQEVRDLIRQVAWVDRDDSLTWAKQIMAIGEESGCFVER